MLVFESVFENDTLPIPWDTFDGGTGASITQSGLATTDIEVYKDVSMTQRASDNGYALQDTDGIDLDGTTGIQGISIDLSDNSDAGFYEVGPWYRVVIASITVDGQTVNFTAAVFRLVSATRGMAGTALPDAAADAAGGLPVSDAGGLDLDTALGTLTNATYGLSAIRTRGDSAWITATSVTVSDKAGFGLASDGMDSVVLPADIITAASIKTGALTADAFAADAIVAATFATDSISAHAIKADAAQEIRNAVTGGAYALDTDANGRVRVVSGTGAGEISLSSGIVKATDQDGNELANKKTVMPR